MFKKIFAALTAAAVILSITACGKDEPKVPELTEDGKKIIKIYTTQTSDVEMYDIIRNFNSRNDEYEVQLTEFTLKYGDESIEKFNADMAAGNYPDILMYDWEGQFPIESYARKGMLADLYDFIDNDPDINREDYIENIFKAYETDGKLYKAITSFSIITLAGKPSIVGTEQGLTFERFTEIINKYPEKPFATKNSALNELIIYGCNNYIDSGKGVCRFDSDEFIGLLKFCDQFPEKEEAYDEYYNIEHQEAVRNGKIPFCRMWIDNFENARYSEYTQFGEPVTFIGFPGVGGNGSVISPCVSKFTVFSVGKNPEGAWQFLKYFYSEEYQNRFATEKVNGKYCNMLPIKKSVLEKLEERSKQLIKDPSTGELTEPFITDMVGNKITIGVNTDEYNQRIYDLMNGAVAESTNLDVINIITEETSFYFAGQRSAEETAEIIQNRVQNYIDESR